MWGGQGDDRERWMRLDLRTQKRTDRPTQLTSGTKPAQCPTLGQIWVLLTLRLARNLVFLFRDIIAL